METSAFEQLTALVQHIDYLGENAVSDAITSIEFHFPA